MNVNREKRNKKEVYKLDFSEKAEAANLTRPGGHVVFSWSLTHVKVFRSTSPCVLEEKASRRTWTNTPRAKEREENLFNLSIRFCGKRKRNERIPRGYSSRSSLTFISVEKSRRPNRTRLNGKTNKQRANYWPKVIAQLTHCDSRRFRFRKFSGNKKKYNKFQRNL